MKNFFLIIGVVTVMILVFGWIVSDPKDSADFIFDEEKEKISVNLFYYSPNEDVDEGGNILCSKDGLLAVNREVSSENFLEETLQILINGELTEDEVNSLGIETEYPLEGLEILSIEKDGEDLFIELFDPFNNTSGGSCRAGILMFQILETAKQFDGVENVIFLPEDELFQP